MFGLQAPPQSTAFHLRTALTEADFLVFGALLLCAPTDPALGCMEIPTGVLDITEPQRVFSLRGGAVLGTGMRAASNSPEAASQL
jgi:hypothetical protein